MPLKSSLPISSTRNAHFYQTCYSRLRETADRKSRSVVVGLFLETKRCFLLSSFFYFSRFYRHSRAKRPLLEGTFRLLGALGPPRRLGPPNAQLIVFINTLARNPHFRSWWPLGPSLAPAACGPFPGAHLQYCAQARCLVTLMLLNVTLGYFYVYLGSHRIQ